MKSLIKKGIFPIVLLLALILGLSACSAAGFADGLKNFGEAKSATINFSLNMEGNEINGEVLVEKIDGKDYAYMKVEGSEGGISMTMETYIYQSFLVLESEGKYEFVETEPSKMETYLFSVLAMFVPEEFIDILLNEEKYESIGKNQYAQTIQDESGKGSFIFTVKGKYISNFKIISEENNQETTVYEAKVSKVNNTKVSIPKAIKDAFAAQKAV